MPHGPVERALLASARRLVRQFDIEGIPFTGIAGSSASRVCWDLNPNNAVNLWFQDNVEDGLKLLNRLQSQLTVLTDSDDLVRESLSQWTELFKKHSAKENRLGGIVEAQHACEDGMRVFSEQLRNLIDPLGLGDLSDDNDSDGDEPMLTIDALVASTTRHCQVSPSSSSPLHTLSEVLYKQNSIKCDPFEWVYEGVYPLTVENVLKRKKATPAAVALAATTVARRTGIPLLPMPAAPIEAGAGHDNRSVGTVPLDVLPLDLQVRMKSASSQSAAPGPGSWLLYYFSAEDTNTKNSTTRGEDMCMDASSGEVMSVLEAKQQFPAAFLPVDSDSDMREEKEREAWRKQSVLKTWQGLCRIAMQGHQRRGESDYVPHWMYVGLALDPLAPEWARALKAPEINVVVDS